MHCRRLQILSDLAGRLLGMVRPGFFGLQVMVVSKGLVSTSEGLIEPLHGGNGAMLDVLCQFDQFMTGFFHQILSLLRSPARFQFQKGCTFADMGGRLFQIFFQKGFVSSMEMLFRLVIYDKPHLLVDKDMSFRSFRLC